MISEIKPELSQRYLNVSLPERLTCTLDHEKNSVTHLRRAPAGGPVCSEAPYDHYVVPATQALLTSADIEASKQIAACESRWPERGVSFSFHPPGGLCPKLGAVTGAPVKPDRVLGCAVGLLPLAFSGTARAAASARHAGIAVSVEKHAGRNSLPTKRNSLANAGECSAFGIRLSGYETAR
jgi:hypothetical protein